MKGQSERLVISGEESGRRIESRVLEERIQEAVNQGSREIEIRALGHHGIGGRLWKAGDESVRITVTGPPGQRIGSMGFPNTLIEIMGNVSDDAGWLNAGADIVVHGHAGNGTANAMAQGRISVAGNIGARGMTMTKHNPRFDPPELWVLGSVGDYFAEFMAGGVAVICGHEPQDPENILGYRPCVGMVGGKVLFRGPHRGYSRADAKQVPISEAEWSWLSENLKGFLKRIQREDLGETLLKQEDWQVLSARTPQEKWTEPRRSMQEFRTQIWDGELGNGGLIGDLVDFDRSQIPLITRGDLRRFVPVWENKRYAAPCEASCPTGIPVQERWRLVREGRVDEAVDLALAYTPFPATVCGYLCPNLCMQGCTRQSQNLSPVDVTRLGQASLQAGTPSLPEPSGRSVAIIGGGPGGISVAWQLRQRGHEAVIFDREDRLGGKISQTIPRSRIPEEVIEAELDRASKALPRVHLQQPLVKDDLERLKADYDAVVLATGAQRSRLLPVPGKERMQPALQFLRNCQQGTAEVGERVVIIGAGNVGCDAAVEANRFGAREITLIDIQEPASFGKERQAAEAVGAHFRWPVFTKEVTDQGVYLTTGELLEAETVIAAVGDLPETEFLPDTVQTDRGFVQVDEHYQTTDPAIFAIGDMVRLGLITEAIGAGREVARYLDDRFAGRESGQPPRPMIDRSRVKLEYFDPRYMAFGSLEECAGECVSCGSCRDCGVCETICPEAAISRHELPDGGFEMVVDPERCIGCGFCAGACPCGIWNLVENVPYAGT